MSTSQLTLGRWRRGGRSTLCSCVSLSLLFWLCLCLGFREERRSCHGTEELPGAEASPETTHRRSRQTGTTQGWVHLHFHYLSSSLVYCYSGALMYFQCLVYLLFYCTWERSLQLFIETFDIAVGTCRLYSLEFSNFSPLKLHWKGLNLRFLNIIDAKI